jgi:hypothetical protein
MRLLRSRARHPVELKVACAVAGFDLAFWPIDHIAIPPAWKSAGVEFNGLTLRAGSSMER